MLVRNTSLADNGAPIFFHYPYTDVLYQRDQLTLLSPKNVKLHRNIQCMKPALAKKDGEHEYEHRSVQQSSQ